MFDFIKSFIQGRPSSSARVGWLFALALLGELISVTYYADYFWGHHYLPAPFSLDKNDTFMDFYHPLFWALKNEFYSTFHSVYPPLNMYLLKLYGWAIDLDSLTDGFELRATHIGLSFVMCATYLGILGLVLNLGEWRKINPKERVFIFLLFVFSAPVLFALERGNLIFYSLAFMALYLDAHSPLKKAFYLGALINIKPYFIILLVQYINSKSFNKEMIVRSIFFSALIFFIFGYFAKIDYVDFFKSYLSFAGKYSISAEGAVVFAHNLSALARIKELIYHGQYQQYNFWFSLLKVISPLSIIVLLYFSWRKPLNSVELLVASIVLLANFSISTGGYIFVIYILLIPYLIYSTEYRFLLIPIIGIFALPMDLINLFSVPLQNKYSYLGGTLLAIDTQDYQIAAGSVIRPLLNFGILVGFLVHLAKKYHNVKCNNVENL